MRKTIVLTILAVMLALPALAQETRVVGKWIDENPRWGTVYTLLKRQGTFTMVREYAGGKSDSLPVAKEKLNGATAYVTNRPTGDYFQPVDGGKSLVVGDRTRVKITCPKLENLNCSGYADCADKN